MFCYTLVGAIIHPEAAQEGFFLTPPENRQRKIHVYTSIDHKFLLADWWKTVDGAQN